MVRSAADAGPGRAEALLARCRAAAAIAPETPRLPFAVDGRPVGSVVDADARLLATRVAGCRIANGSLSLATAGDTDAAFGAIATLLRDAGRLGRWRGEALPVRADDDSVIGAIERAAMRPLGLRTVAVHLVGHDGDGALWVQRRAVDKDVDPGRLDTLAGGLAGFRGNDRGAAETVVEAIRRESLEEAGVDPVATMRPIDLRLPRIMRPVAEGYMVEDVVAFEAMLAPGFVPSNHDGEVSGFERLDTAGALARIARGEFTLEASLVILAWLSTGGRAAPARSGARPRIPPAGPE